MGGSARERIESLRIQNLHPIVKRPDLAVPCHAFLDRFANDRRRSCYVHRRSLRNGCGRSIHRLVLFSNSLLTGPDASGLAFFFLPRRFHRRFDGRQRRINNENQVVQDPPQGTHDFGSL